MLDDILDKDEFEHIEFLEELEKAIDKRLEEYNQTPQEDLGGLSPKQAYRLLHTDWTGTESPMVIHDSLPDSDVGEVRFVKNSRILLEAAREQDGLPATKAGNLKRKVVAEFLDTMDFDPYRVEIIHIVNKVINEHDVRPLHILRVVLEVGNLLKRTGSTFNITSHARSLLEPGKGGKFMKYLFLTYFRDFNIAYFTRGEELPEIQDTLPFIFYQLSLLDESWHERKSLIDRLILPSIRDKAEELGEDLLWMDYSIKVLRPLVKFNLLETRRVGEGKRYEQKVEYRKRPLFDQFIKFNL